MDINDAKKIFKENFIGPDELIVKNNPINIKLPRKVPEIKVDISLINPNDYILILGIEKLNNNDILNIENLVSIFGVQPKNKSVSFYNQDWYLGEEFAQLSLSNKWYLIQKKVINQTRGVTPNSNMEDHLPSSILCAFTFFSWWFLRNEILWENDFIWCSDKDRYGDRIYVGKYLDLDDNARSGFSIHRHLSIKSNYGCIKSL